MSEQKRRCCDLRGLDFIEVNGRKVGVIGLRQIFAEVAALGLSDPEEIARELLARAEKRNWIPEKDRSVYAAALLYEYWAQTSLNKQGGGKGTLPHAYPASFLRMETSLPPCHPGEVEWGKAEAELTDDVSPVLPYLNAIMKGTVYDPENYVLNFKTGSRDVALYARKIVVTRLRNENDAEEVLEKLRNLINRVWEQRDKIKPSYKTRAKITALEIYKYLPKTNCGACGVSTCLAFALRLISEEASIQDCKLLFDLGHTEERGAFGPPCGSWLR